MAHVSSLIGSFNLLDATRRAHRARKGPPLVPGAGKVVANGKLRVELPLSGGCTVVYVATPKTVWRFEPDTTARPKSPVVVPATPADRVKRALDAALDEIVNLDKRARAAVPAARAAIPNIAA